MRSLRAVQSLPGFQQLVHASAGLSLLALTFSTVAPCAFAETSGRSRPRMATNRDHPLLFLSGLAPIESMPGAVSMVPPGSRVDRTRSVAPRTLAAAEFNGDGMPDLLVGYASPDGAFVTLYPGNIDALFPATEQARIRELRSSSIPSPFLPAARMVPIPVDPDFLATGDFDADGHQDFVVANRAEPTLYWFRGDSRGGFSESNAFDLEGLPDALLVSDLNRSDGLPDIAVAISSTKSAEIWVLEGPDGALRSTPERFLLMEPAGELSAGNLDSGFPRRPRRSLAGSSIPDPWTRPDAVCRPRGPQIGSSRKDRRIPHSRGDPIASRWRIPG